jgi:hypothetical protein
LRDSKLSGIAIRIFGTCSELGQKAKFRSDQRMSAFVSIVLQKSFCGMRLKFLEP